MFLLSKAVTGFPKRFLYWLGTPFHWEPDNNILRYSEQDLKDKFSTQRGNHYGPRILFGSIFMLVFVVLIILAVVSNFAILLAIPFIGALIFLIDGLLGLARLSYYTQEKEKKASRNEVMIVDEWKDTSLKALLDKRHTAQVNANAFREEEMRKFNNARVASSNY